MHGMRVRRLFIHSSVLALTLGVSSYMLAQDASSAGSSPSGTQSDSSTKSVKKSKGSADASSKSNANGASDKMFVMKAARGGMSEVELGTLATQKGSSDDVKQFGQKMVDDHSKANDELKSLAQQKGITLPTDSGAEGKAMKAKLDKLSGDQFDKAYMQHMVKDHKKDVAEFKKEADSGKDSDVKAWAGKTLPTLEGHLSTAQDTWKKMGGTAAAGESDKGAKKGKKAGAGGSASQ